MWMSRVVLGLMVLCWSSLVLANDVAIVVGVSDYEHLEAPQDLKFADEDARLFARTLHEQMKFAKEDIIVLTSKPQPGERLASAENILAAFAELPSMRIDPAESKFIFYFSGHGLNSQEHGPHLAAQDHLPGKPLSGASLELTAAKIRERLSGITAEFAMAVYDMCRPRLASSLNASKEVNSQFGLAKQNAKMVATVFSSMEGSSFEDDKLGHGIFTYYFCRGMTAVPESGLPIVGGMADNGSVTLESLRDYLREEMIQTTSTPKGDLAIPGNLVGLGGYPEFQGDAKTLSAPLIQYDPLLHQRTIPSLAEYSVLRRRGLIAYEGERFSEAAVFFQTAFELRPFKGEKDSWAALATASSFFRNQDLPSAEEWFQRALQVNPKSAEATASLGALLQLRGDKAGAEEKYLNAVSLGHPHSTVLQVLLAALCVDKGDLNKAEELYRSAIAHSPNFPIARYNLGVLLYEKGDTRGAESEFLATVSIDPTHADAIQNLGTLLEQRGDYSGAERVFRDAVQANPKSVAFKIRLGTLLAARGDLEGSAEEFESASILEPQNGEPVYYLGLVRLQEGKLALAEEKFKEAIGADPENVKAMFYLGLLELSRGNEVEAKAHFQKVTIGDKDDAENLAGICETILLRAGSLTGRNLLINIGNLLLERGHHIGAEAMFRACQGTYPDCADAFVGIGDILKAKGDLEGAANQYQLAIEVDPKSSRAMVKLAGTFEERGELSQAASLLRAASIASPSDAYIHFLLGLTLERSGDAEGAVDALRVSISLAKEDRLARARLQIIRVAGDEPEALYRAELGLVLLKQGMRDEAVKEAQEAKRLGLKEHPVFEKLGIE
jgi:tetratricopeptide (TPR) repeat protein